MTHIVIEDSELKVDRDVPGCVRSVRAGVEEVEADHHGVVQPHSTLAVPAADGEVPGGDEAGD